MLQLWFQFMTVTTIKTSNTIYAKLYKTKNSQTFFKCMAIHMRIDTIYNKYIERDFQHVFHIILPSPIWIKRIMRKKAYLLLHRDMGHARSIQMPETEKCVFKRFAAMSETSMHVVESEFCHNILWNVACMHPLHKQNVQSPYAKYDPY